MKKLVLISAIFLLAGCITKNSVRPQLSEATKKRAAFDFNCPAEKISMEETSLSMVAYVGYRAEYQVQGCDQRQSYNATFLDEGQTSVVAVGSPGEGLNKVDTKN